jgi:hypothetical protein
VLGVPLIAVSDKYASSDLTFYFSSSDLIIIYIRNLICNLSNYLTKYRDMVPRNGTSSLSSIRGREVPK